MNAPAATTIKLIMTKYERFCNVYTKTIENAPMEFRMVDKNTAWIMVDTLTECFPDIVVSVAKGELSDAQVDEVMSAGIIPGSGLAGRLKNDRETALKYLQPLAEIFIE